MAASSNFVVGIDLGTTFFKISVFRNDKVIAVRNPLGDLTTPSWVAYTHKECVVGKAAISAVCPPGNKVYDVKRMLGLTFDDPKVQDKIKDWPFNVVGVDNKPHVQVQCNGKTETYSPEEISAEVLKYLKKSAEICLGCEVTQAVVTIPAYFNNSQRQATIEAARLAGLEVLRLLSEPVAAVMAYIMDNKYEIQGNVLVYDLGGGTFDVSILKAEGCIIEVLSTNGNTHLGGNDFTSRLLNHVIAQLKELHGIVVPYDRKMEKLHKECEERKKMLTGFDAWDIEYDDAVVEVTRATFDALNHDLYKKTLLHVELALKDAKLEKSDIWKVVMVGGSSHINKIQSLVMDYFQRDLLTMSINVDEVVAHGAAILAAKLNEDPSPKLKDLVWRDITPSSLGVESGNGNMTIVVKRNSRIPLTVSHNFSTLYDKQTSLTFLVYEGEQPLGKDNTFLGSLLIENIPPAPRGTLTVKVVFQISNDGSLTVTATDMKTYNNSRLHVVAYLKQADKASREQVQREAQLLNEKLKKDLEAKDQVPSPPIGLKAERIKDTSMTTSWQSPHDVNSIIRGYQVSYTPHGESECLRDVAGDTTSTELTSLKPHTEYTIRVRAKTVDFGDYSSTITVSTLNEDLIKKLSILDDYNGVKFQQLRVIKLIFYGTPRAGKTTLRKQLLRSVEDPLQPSSATTLQPSTNIAELCDPVFVERIVMTNEENNVWKWTVQKLDEVAKALLQCLNNQLLQKEAIDVKEESNVTAAQGFTPATHMPLNQYVRNEKMAGTPNVYVPPSEIVTERVKSHLPKTTLPTVEQDEIHASSTVPDIKQLFYEAVKTGQWSEVVSALNIDRAILMQVIDGGGQPSFQEIFPLLISGPSVTLLVFKLTDDLQKAHDVQYQPIDGVERTWKDTYVVRDFIFQALSSIVQFADGKIDPIGSKILLVGTHKDQIKGSDDQKKAEIMNIAESIRGLLKDKDASKSIHCKKIKDLLTDINNFEPKDIQIMKNKIENLVLYQTPSKDIPAPWLVFDFVLHKDAKSKQLGKVERKKSEQIAKSCGVKVEEFEGVLKYLHYEAGTLLYYPDIPELKVV